MGFSGKEQKEAASVNMTTGELSFSPIIGKTVGVLAITRTLCQDGRAQASDNHRVKQITMRDIKTALVGFAMVGEI